MTEFLIALAAVVGLYVLVTRCWPFGRPKAPPVPAATPERS